MEVTFVFVPGGYFWLGEVRLTLYPEWTLMALNTDLCKNQIQMDASQHQDFESIVFLLIKGSQAAAVLRKCLTQRSASYRTLIFSELWAKVCWHTPLPATYETFSSLLPFSTHSATFIVVMIIFKRTAPAIQTFESISSLFVGHPNNCLVTPGLLMTRLLKIL